MFTREQRTPTLPIEEWNHSQKGDYLWSNTNFGEAVTEVMTPLAWSVLQFTLEDWRYLPGYATTGNIGGFPYLNISVFATLFKRMGRSRQDLMAEMESTLYMRLPDEMEIPTIPLSLGASIRGMLNALQIQGKQRRGLKHLPVYLATNQNWFERMQKKIRAIADSIALQNLWQDEIAAHIKQGVWTVLGTATHSSAYTMNLRRDLTALVGPEDANALIANLSTEGDLLLSLGPLEGLARVALGDLARADYLDQFGHRGPHEFEISIPRPVEDPHWLDQQIAQFLESPHDIQDLLARQSQAFDDAWQRLMERYPQKAEVLLGRIKESAQLTRQRESARSEYIRDRWLVRIFACRAGELTGLADDVFYLHLAETLALLAGERSAVESVPERKEIYQCLKALPPYPSIIRGPFDPFQWAADPHRRTDIFNGSARQESSAQSKDEPNLVRGAAGSAGRVEGLVRRLDRPEDGSQLQQGEILVTTLTDISWTPVFPRAAAVITDVGAPLSHAAIVARELGIPAVVGCGDATARLQTGDRVRVDGGRGMVEILGSKTP